VDSFAAAVVIFFEFTTIFSKEVAKLRAARRIWAGDEGALWRAIRALVWAGSTARTAGVSLFVEQPENNIISALRSRRWRRSSAERKSLHTTAWTRRCVPVERAVRIALRTQANIAHEAV